MRGKTMALLKWFLVSIFAISIQLTFVGTLEAKPEPFQAIVKAASKAYADANYDLALSKFQEAYAIKPMTALLYNMGRAYESKADFPSAIEYYTKFVSSPDVDHESRTEALERINTLNEVLQLNGGRSVTPAKKTTPAGSARSQSAKKANETSAAPKSGACIDINTATSAQLMELKGIGEKKANDILESRQSAGLFKSFSDITRVKGIGEKSVAKFSSQLCPIGSGSAAGAEAATISDKSAAPAKSAPKTEKKSKAKSPKSETSDNWDI